MEECDEEVTVHHLFCFPRNAESLGNLPMYFLLYGRVELMD